MVRLLYAALFVCLSCSFFLLSSTALARTEEHNYPSVKADTIALPADQQRYLLYVFYNNGYANDPNFSWTSIETAIKNGCNGIELCVPWSEIYPTRNGPAYWATLDKQIDRIIQLGAKVALRIGLHRDLDRVDTFWTEENGVHNAQNELLYRAHARQFSMAYQPTLDLATDFVGQVARRYSNRQQQGNILFVAVTNTPILEQEYMYEREILYQPGLTSTITDYSKAMVTGFRAWLTTKYPTISALNTAWGSHYVSFNDVPPPGLLEPTVYTAFTGNRGKDWYAYRHKVHKGFIDQTTNAIKSADGSYKVVNGYGSIFDDVSVFRGTLGFKNYAQNADGVKVDNGPFYPHRFTMDLVRSNVGPGKWVMNEMDGQNPAGYGLGVYMDWATQSFEHGAKAITLANFTGDVGLDYVRQICQQLWARGWKNKPIPDFKPVGTIPVKLSKLVEVGYSQLGIQSQWNQIYSQNGNQPVNIPIDEDLLADMPTAVTTTSSLSILAPTVDCSTGSLTFKTAGGDGTPVEFMAVGLQSWSTNTTVVIDISQRNGVTFTLKARQSGKELSYDYTTACVTTPVNKPPVLVNPITSQTLVQGTAYSLVIPTNTFADSDGVISAWGVSSLPQGLTYNATTRTISGTATTVGASQVTLTVTDNGGASAQQTIAFIIVAAPPTVTTGSALSLIAPGYDCVTGKLIFRTRGGDGTAIEYTALGAKPWSTDSVIIVDAWQRTGVTFALQARQSDKLTVYTFTTICPANKPPVVVTPIGSQTATLARSFSFVIPAATFSDPDGQVVSWTATGLPVGLTFDAATHTISGTPSLIGPNSVTISVIDNLGASVQTSFVLQVLGNNSTPSTPPAPASLSLVAPDFNCTTGRLVFKAVGGDGTPVEYFAVGIKTWSRDSVGSVDTWLREGVTFTLQARQSGKVVTYSFRTSCLSNKPPVVVTPIGSQTATLARSFSFVIPAATFSDPDGQVVSWTATGLPVGLTFDAATHTISGTPSLIGPNSVTISVIDNLGASVQTSFVLQVLGNNSTPSTPPAPASLSLVAPDFNCTTGRLVFKAVGGDGTPVEYFAVGIKTWSRDSVGSVDTWLREGVTFTLQARQSGKVVTYSFRTSCLSNKPPVVVTPIGSQTATLARSFSFVIPAATFSDPDGQVVSWTATGLPVGLTFDAATHTISGTPSLIGPNSVTISVTDNLGASVQTSFVLQVSVSSGPRIVTPTTLSLLAPDFNCTTGRLLFKTTGGDGTPIDYMAVGIKSWSRDSVAFIDPWLRDGVVFTLKAHQSGKIVIYSFTTTCGTSSPNGRIAAPETETSSWQVWPNPVEHELTVALPIQLTTAKLRIVLSSVSGFSQNIAIESTRIENGQLHLAMPLLQTGLYFLHVYDGDKPLQTLKVLKR